MISGSFPPTELEKITQVSLERDGPHSLLMRWQLECSALKSFVDGYQIEACAVADKYRNMALHDAAGEVPPVARAVLGVSDLVRWRLTRGPRSQGHVQANIGSL